MIKVFFNVKVSLIHILTLWSDARTKSITKHIYIMPATKKKTQKEDPCWNGYKQEGMKSKGGKKVPNCVPEKKSASK
jgi:hypothetical protein